jgi:hypothetical protein
MGFVHEEEERNNRKRKMGFGSEREMGFKKKKTGKEKKKEKCYRRFQTVDLRTVLLKPSLNKFEY